MSFNYQNQRVQIWGVMNVTPDSFSDGGHLATLDQVQNKLTAWLPHVDGVDLGAESTAPHNRALTAAEERARLEKFVAPLLSHWPSKVTLSLDSYHPENIEWLAQTANSDTSLVWNDVSGMADEQVMGILKRFPKLRYVLCFNQVPTRGETQDHMKHVSSEAIVPAARQFFRKNFEAFLRQDLFSRLIADPCFGFAKSREQNHELLKHLPGLMEELACPQWMWGVSRKSFLRFPADANPRDPAVQSELDALGVLWARESLDRLVNPHTIVLRTHAPLSSKALASWHVLKEQWTSKS